MDDEQTRNEIERLEERIEVLSDALARCRKFELAAKAAMAAGGLLIVLMVFGVLRDAALNVIGALAAIIGGVVLYGSNVSTHREIATAIQAAQIERNALIDALSMRDVGDIRTLH